MFAINGNDQSQDATKTLLSHKKFCKKACQRLIKKKASTPLKSQGKWLAEDLIGNETVNWESTYSLPFWCSKETKLREFQFKLLHRRITTNDFLYKIGIKQSDSCTFCGEATENLVHLFWSCKYSNPLLERLLSMDNAKHHQSRQIQSLRSARISFLA